MSLERAPEALDSCTMGGWSGLNDTADADQFYKRIDTDTDATCQLCMDAAGVKQSSRRNPIHLSSAHRLVFASHSHRGPPTTWAWLYTSTFQLGQCCRGFSAAVTCQPSTPNGGGDLLQPSRLLSAGMKRGMIKLCPVRLQSDACLKKVKPRRDRRPPCLRGIKMKHSYSQRVRRWTLRIR